MDKIPSFEELKKMGAGWVEAVKANPAIADFMTKLKAKSEPIHEGEVKPQAESTSVDVSNEIASHVHTMRAVLAALSQGHLQQGEGLEKLSAELSALEQTLLKLKK